MVDDSARRPARHRSLQKQLAALLASGLADPAVNAALVAVLVNLLVRIAEFVHPSPWDPLIEGAMALYTIQAVVKLMLR